MAETKRNVPATEFFRWRALFEKEGNDFNPLHWYLAQIAFEVNNVPFRVWGKDSERKIKDFLLKFQTHEEVSVPKSLDPEALKAAAIERIKVSQAVWGTARKQAEQQAAKNAKRLAKINRRKVLPPPKLPSPSSGTGGKGKDGR